MATRKRLYHPDEVREKIQASQLVNVLRNHVSGKLERHACPECKHEWGEDVSMTRIKAAEILLKKAMPDLSAIEYSQQEEMPSEGTVLDRVSKILDASPGLQMAVWQQTTTKVLTKPVSPEIALEGCLSALLASHVSFKRALLERLQADLRPSELDAAPLEQVIAQ